jgi:hypothetical protein
MTIERIKGKISFFCDLESCDEGLETDEADFQDAKWKADDEGWLFRRRDGEWKHYCCAAHEEKDYRGQKA